MTTSLWEGAPRPLCRRCRSCGRQPQLQPQHPPARRQQPQQRRRLALAAAGSGSLLLLRRRQKRQRLPRWRQRQPLKSWQLKQRQQGQRQHCPRHAAVVARRPLLHPLLPKQRQQGPRQRCPRPAAAVARRRPLLHPPPPKQRQQERSLKQPAASQGGGGEVSSRKQPSPGALRLHPAQQQLQQQDAASSGFAPTGQTLRSLSSSPPLTAAALRPRTAARLVGASARLPMPARTLGALRL